MSRDQGTLVFPAKVIHPGNARGEALVSADTVSFWGGVDPRTGTITDVHHDQRGASMAGKVFAFPRGSGSSSGCGVLMEMVRLGTNPAAIVNVESESILAMGPVISAELYGRDFPIVTVDQGCLDTLRTGDLVSVDTDSGTLTIQRSDTDSAD